MVVAVVVSVREFGWWARGRVVVGEKGARAGGVVVAVRRWWRGRRWWRAERVWVWVSGRV